MKIINTTKIKIILFLFITIFILLVIVSFLHISCKNKSYEEEKSLILEPAPEVLLTPSYLQSQNNPIKYSIDNNGNIMLIDEFDKSYTIEDDGKIYEIKDNNEKQIVQNTLKKKEILNYYEDAVKENATIKNMINPNTISLVKNSLEPSVNDTKDKDEKTNKKLLTLSEFQKSKLLSSNQNTPVQKRESFLIPIKNPNISLENSNKAIPEDPQHKSKMELTDSLTATIRDLNRSENEYETQNAQTEKLKFIETGTNTIQSFKQPNNRTIAPGTIIPITLITGINSDLPGLLLSQISANIYDTATGSNLLINKGAKLIGKYDSSVSYNQNRLIVIWDTLIETDGSVKTIPSLIGIDKDGKSGWSGSVDKHLWNLLSTLGVSAAINLGTTALTDKTDSTILNALLSASSKSASSVANTLINKQINNQPTIKIDRGTEYNVIVTSTLEF